MTTLQDNRMLRLTLKAHKSVLKTSNWSHFSRLDDESISIMKGEESGSDGPGLVLMRRGALRCEDI